MTRRNRLWASCLHLYLLLDLNSTPRVKQTAVKLLTLLSLLLPFALSAQEGAPTDCFNAQEVIFPLSANDFSKSAVLVKGSTANALYYQYQDKYTFWYKFVVRNDQRIQFSVSATKEEDRYGVTAYRYGKNDFCDKLVNQGLDPIDLKKATVLLKSGKLLYLNTIEGKANDTIYISVLSLNKDDCGHFLRIESDEQKLSLHAIHRPCYDFSILEIPDFSLARDRTEDVSLFLENMLKKESEAPTAPVSKGESSHMKSLGPERRPIPKTQKLGFESLTSVTVERADDEMISVGDKLTLNQVFFYANTYAFKPESEEELQQLLNFLLDNPNLSIEIQGHTANNSEDIKPDPNFKGQGKEWNFKGNSLKLSEERANAVREYLISNGISKKRTIAKGYGDTQLKVKNAQTIEDAEKNMRVEVVITGT